MTHFNRLSIEKRVFADARPDIMPAGFRPGACADPALATSRKVPVSIFQRPGIIKSMAIAAARHVAVGHPAFTPALQPTPLRSHISIEKHAINV
jgi:hypothetical protein